MAPARPPRSRMRLLDAAASNRRGVTAGERTMKIRNYRQRVGRAAVGGRRRRRRLWRCRPAAASPPARAAAGRTFRGPGWSQVTLRNCATGAPRSGLPFGVAGHLPRGRHASARRPRAPSLRPRAAHARARQSGRPSATTPTRRRRIALIAFDTPRRLSRCTPGFFAGSSVVTHTVGADRPRSSDLIRRHERVLPHRRHGLPDRLLYGYRDALRVGGSGRRGRRDARRPCSGRVRRRAPPAWDRGRSRAPARSTRPDGTSSGRGRRPARRRDRARCARAGSPR